MRRRALALFACILVLGLMPRPALADGGLDQVNEARNYNFLGPGTLAQTVTVGQTGKLTGVDLFLYEAKEAKTNVSIYRLDFTGKPAGQALASATVSVSTEDWYHVAFATPVSFNSGSGFAIVFPVTAEGWAFGSSGSYSGGQALEVSSGSWANLKGDANLDFAFRTWVVPAAVPIATPAPVATPTPAPKLTPTATGTPVPTSSPTTPAESTASPSTDMTSPAASASASPSARSDSQSGGSGDSGGPPILIVIVGIVALAAVLGGGIGLGFLLARRRQ